MGIKKNFAFNSILTVSNYIFPLLTFPYISRVLGVSNVGLCNFTDSVINYFILFSMLGISAVGIREIAKSKVDHKKLNSTFSSLLFLNAISTFIALISLLLAVIFVPKLHENWELMFLGGVKLLFNCLLTEWFFRGIEDFKYITIRSVIVKAIFVVSVFIFVKHETDVQIYYTLLVTLVVVNSIFNYVYRRRFVTFSFKCINFTPFLKSYITIGFYMLLTSMYTSFNIAYLGFVSGNIEVGYYTTATKLYSILLSLFTAFTAVMLPRMSALVAERKIDEVRRLIVKSYDALIAFCLPLIIVSTIFAPQIINLIAGSGYEGAIVPMRIVMPLMLIIGIEQILVLQLMVPLKMDNKILINSVLGASVGLLLNILLVSKFKSVGSAIVWVCSEISVLVMAQYFVKKSLNIQFPYKRVLINIIYALPIVIISLCIKKLTILPSVLELIVAFALCSIYFLLVQVFLIKNELVIKMWELLQKIKLKVDN
nr:flippase [uncultured Marinifilum sp.]